jgi:hypothetical protein
MLRVDIELVTVACLAQGTARTYAEEEKREEGDGVAAEFPA